MTDVDRNELIEVLIWLTGWTQEAYDSMDDRTLIEHYERRVGPLE